ncbi:hypothetical protein BHE74_00028461, partial [Ensete ventricosum]
MQINDRYEFPLQLDLDRDDGKYLSPEADRRVRNLYTLHSCLKQGLPNQFVPTYLALLGTVWYPIMSGEKIARGRWIARRRETGRQIARRGKKSRFSFSSCSSSFSLPQLRPLFFFLPPRLRPLEIDQQRTETTVTWRYRPVAGGPRTSQLADLYVPPGTGPFRRFWLIWNSGCSLKMEISFVTKELPHYKMATNIDILMFLLSWSTFVIARSVYSGLVWMAILPILSKLSTYDDVVERVARQLGLDDPSKIRLTSHNCYSQQPKPQPIKFRGLEHLSEMLVHYNQVELSRPDAELRLLEVFYHKIYKQVQNFGEPFFLVIREGETLADVKIRVQKKLQVPDEEFSKYLGLEHSDTAPKRAYTSNQVKWLLVCRPVGNGIV